MDNLPEIQDAVGRANKYAAEAFLAKAYMFDEKFNDAKTLLNELIQKGVTAKGIPYQLMPNFGDNFNIEFKNQSESVFAVQASVNDGSGGLNGNMADVLNFPQTSIPTNIPGQCCGFFQPSQYLVDLYKTDSVTGLPDLNSGVSVKNDQGISSDSVFTPYSGTLDPRLDWTVGRRGVPYLDWGPDPGMGWIRDQNYSGPYLPKKNIYYESQQQKFTESTFWTTGATANNVNLLRFSDILLWAAEAEIETNGDLNKARDYVNQVRQRAANTPGLVKNDDNSPNAKATTNSQAEFDVFNDPAYPLNPYDWVVRKDINQTWVFLKTNSDGTKVWNAYTPPRYNIQIYTDAWTDPNFARKAVRYERALELAMEGHRFFDLVRWGIADIEINNYLQKEQKLRTYLNDAKFRKGKNEYYPIPQIEIDLSTDANGIAHLIQNPGY
jgi:hypothetical protein